jgi:hypothetical protein
LKLGKFGEQNVRQRTLSVLVGVILILGLAFLLNKGIINVEKPVMMRTTATNGPYFDATKWFVSGMYKQRKEIMSGKEIDSEVSMLRVAPPSFSEKQNTDLASWAAYALERYYPHENTDFLLLFPPDLRHRIVYIGSGFDEPERPIDGYTLYLTLGKKHFTIDFSRDGLTGEILHASNALLITLGSNLCLTLVS